MPDPSIHAAVCDLLGRDPDVPVPDRPTVARARRQCPPGHVTACRRGRRAAVLIVRPDGSAAVAPDRCPHDGGPLSDGFIEDGHLVCARHGWAFDLTTGVCAGRSQVKLALEPVRSRRARSK